MSSTITLQKLAELVDGELVSGSADSVITGLNSIAEAGPGDATFMGNIKYLPALKTTRAAAALVPLDLEGIEAPPGLALIRVSNPTMAFSSVIRWFGPPSADFDPGVHPTAVVASRAVFDPQKVSIGAHAVIGEDVVIGDGTIIQAGVFIGRGARLGTDCVIHANVAIKDHCILGSRVIIHSCSAIGTDGFGYEMIKGRHQKVDQVGIVQIDDDVEIGSCSTVDRARFGRTWIGEGTKIDNLVQIGHNVVIGKHCMIVSQVGIAGSCRLGDYVTLAGQVGVVGHLEIGEHVVVLAKSVVTKSLPLAGAYVGYPAKPLVEGRKLMALPARIPDLLDRVRELERRLAALEGPTAKA